jgi:hypothetical protein
MGQSPGNYVSIILSLKHWIELCLKAFVTNVLKTPVYSQAILLKKALAG